MLELIDKEATLKKMCELCGNRCEKFEKAMRTTHLDFVTYKCSNYRFLSEQPVVEAEPVRHGHWIAVSAFDACGGDEEAWMAHGNPIAYHYCSECKNETYLNEEGKEILSDYCPFCGADMREVSEDAGTD